MIDVAELFILQMWRPDLAAWWDVRNFDLAELAHEACDAARSLDDETRWRVVRRWH